MAYANDFSQVEVLIAVDNRVIRKGLWEAFKRLGFGKVEEASTYVQTHAAIRDGRFDLLVAVSEMESFFIGHLIKELRHARLGAHPFPVVMMLLPLAEHDHVRQVIDCGADDLLLIPVAPDQLLSRVQSLTRVRKPFIVTHDYIGPDRRKAQRRESEPVPLLDVPNPIQSKAVGISAAAFQRDLLAAGQRLNVMKVERHGVQIRWLERTIRELFQAQPFDAARVQGHAQRLGEVVADLKARTTGWSNDRLGKAADTLATAAGVIGAAGKAATPGQLDALSETCAQTAQEIVRSLPHLEGMQSERG